MPHPIGRTTLSALAAFALGGCAHTSNVAKDNPYKGDAAYDACRSLPAPDKDADSRSRCLSRAKRVKASAGQSQIYAAPSGDGQTPPAALPVGAITVYDSKVIAHFQPDADIKRGAAYESCIQMMNEIQNQYGRAPSCVAVIENGVDMSDVKHTVLVTFDGTDRRSITVFTDVVSDSFLYSPDQINKLALEAQHGAGKSRAEWTQYYWRFQYQAAVAGLDYEQRILERGGTVIDDSGGGHRKLKPADLKMLRRRIEETNRKIGAAATAPR